MWNSLKKYFYLFLKYAAPIGLFLLLPMLVVLYLGHNIINQEKSKHLSELSSLLENNLNDIESEIPSKSFMLKVARGAWFTLSNNINQQKFFWDYYNRLCLFLNSKPDFYLFDDKGLLITPKNINLKSRFTASKLWQTIGASYDERTESVNKLKKQFQGFLGSEFKLGTFLEARNRLMPIILNTKEGYVYWMNFAENPKKGILIVFWNVPSLDFRFNQIIDRYSSKFDFAYTRYLSGEVKIFGKKSQSFNFDNIYLKTVLMNPKDGYLDSEGMLWKSVKLDNFYLIASLKSNSLNYDHSHSTFIITIFLSSLFIVLLYLFLTTKLKFYFSIKTKIIILFLIAVFVPVMEFAFLGYQYITDMENNLRAQFGNESRDILHNIDKELGNSSNVFRDDFREIVKNFQKYDVDVNARRNIDESLAKNELVAIERRVASDASIIRNKTNYLVFEGLNIVADPIAKYCIDTKFNTNLMDSVDPVLRTAMNSPEFGLAIFATSPDKVQNFSFGTLQFYLYWCFTHSQQYGLEYYLALRLTDNTLRDYLKKRLEKCKTDPKEKDYFIFICNDKKEEWFPNNALSKDLKPFSRRISFIGKPIESEITLNSNRYLLLVQKSIKLNGYSFYILYPYKIIEEKINKFVLYIIASIILFIIIALCIGFRLSETFLYPIKRLEDGVKAIKLRQTEFRIESLQNDEFGALAQSFNKMITDLKEMELASYIQESLMPKNIPSLNGYQLSFSNKMASGVGGDYFDTILLDNENLCIIIGDVSGHGVASALVMAIAKAVIYHGFNRTRNLLELFSDLNSVISTYFYKPPVKKMITLFATIVNLPSGKASFLNSGHNYPIKLSKDGCITDIIMNGLPIGILKKMRKSTVQELLIEEGESIVFYTDGIVEATGKTTEQYGYDRFKESLSHLSNESPDKIINILLKNYEKWEDGTEPDDDVTLAVLKRLPS